MKAFNLNQSDLFGNLPQFSAPQSTCEIKLVAETPRKKATNRVRRPRKSKVENTLPLFSDSFFDGVFETKPVPAPKKAANDESKLSKQERIVRLGKQADSLWEKYRATPKDSPEREKIMAELTRVRREKYELEYPDEVAAEKQAAQEESKKKEYFTNQPKQKYARGSWEEAREIRTQRYELFAKTTDDLKIALENRQKELPQDMPWRADDVCSRFNYELERRANTETFAAQGFTPTGDDVSTIPNFLLNNVISVNRTARKFKGYGMRPVGKNERFFVNEQLLHYRECPTPDKFGQKVFESVIYTGFELSFDEVLVFLALIKNTTNLQQRGYNQWSILKCKKRFIIDFLGWNYRSGKFNQKILSTLDVLTQGFWKIEWRSDANGKINVYGGHLIADYYLSKTEIAEKAGSVPENLEDLTDGEFYYRIAPPLIRLFNNYFFKANISVIRAFLRNKGTSLQTSRATDLKAWFYLYLMSLHEKTEFISLAVIKEKSGYTGELKELKRVMMPILADLSLFFSVNGGCFSAQWDEKDKYRLNILNFQKTRLNDIDLNPDAITLLGKNYEKRR